MKKALLTIAAAIATLCAAAQNKAIDRLAEKYTDADGYTVVNLTDEAVHALSAIIPTEKFGDANVTLDDGSTFTAADLLRDISSVTAVIAKRPAGAFAADVRGVVNQSRYSSVAQITSDGVEIHLMSAKARRGQRELVLTILDDETEAIVRVLGKVDMKLLSQAAQEIFRGIAR